MLLSRIWIVLAWGAVLMVPTPAPSAVVWKWTDADGVVHFSDQPVEGAQRIVTSTGSKGIGGGPLPAAQPEAQKPKPTGLNFREFAITSPGREETITGNQPVLVSLALAPALTSTQSITWFLNGQPLNQAPDAIQLTLEDLPRGTYSIMATVADQSSGESKSTEPVTFYVVRPSILSPTHK